MNIDQLSAELVIDEGLRLKPYRDSVGILTIGIGRNLDQVGITKDEALLMLKNDIDRVCDQLDNVLPWWKQMTEPRQRALANMTFNMGITTVLKFKNSLALLRAGKYDAAADAFLDSNWARQTGQRAVRVTTMIREG